MSSCPPDCTCKKHTRFCKICGGPLRSDNVRGICQRNPNCHNENSKQYYWENTPEGKRPDTPPSCEICGGPIKSTNTIGVCKKTDECKREAWRRNQRVYAGKNPERLRERRRASYQRNKPNIRARFQDQYKTADGLRRQMLYNARARSRDKGWPCDLTIDDIPEIPEVCPLLGIPLVIDPTLGGNDDTPSLDRIDSRKRYVRGNLWIVSKRGNAIKNDATPDELRQVADAVEARLRLSAA